MLSTREPASFLCVGSCRGCGWRTEKEDVLREVVGAAGFCNKALGAKLLSFCRSILPPGPPVRSGGRGLVVGRQHETSCTSWGKTHLEAERLGENGIIFHGRRDISNLETSRLCEARGLKKPRPPRLGNRENTATT